MNSSVVDFIRREVPDWDDEVISVARFKAFSGQRWDWEPKFLFWRDLILKLARHLGVFFILAPEVKNNWFIRGGLTPLCIDNVLLEMYKAGDIVRSGDLMDPRSGRLYQMFIRVSHVIGISNPSTTNGIFEDRLILKALLQERADEVVKLLSESHWTSSCVVTMEKFQSICKGSDEASAILSYLSGCVKARYLSINKKDFIEGVKVSLVPAAVPSISSLDYDALHLIWTTEKLQQQLDVIDRRYEKSRKSALDSLKSGNKQAAHRHIRQLKLTSNSREKCTALLNRVEEVIGVIANAESTKKVSEAIQIGARAIKENGISIEEVHFHLQELDESVASQRQVEETLESMPLHSTDIEDDVEEEFKKLEMELENEKPQVQITGTILESAATKAKVQESAESLCQTLSNLKLEAA
ncbi:SNF7 family protein [Tasmannia lanceolata]|uniref:SNF7 family protein n=1 Tax=Tasmannia lanceolata TaxID=3420 RepID=UPI004063D2F7